MVPHRLSRGVLQNHGHPACHECKSWNAMRIAYIKIGELTSSPQNEKRILRIYGSDILLISWIIIESPEKPRGAMCSMCSMGAMGAMGSTGMAIGMGTSQISSVNGQVNGLHRTWHRGCFVLGRIFGVPEGHGQHPPKRGWLDYYTMARKVLFNNI